MGENDRQRHTFFGLIRRVAEHQALIASAELVVGLLLVYGLRNVRRLLFESNEHVHCLVVESFLG